MSNPFDHTARYVGTLSIESVFTAIDQVMSEEVRATDAAVQSTAERLMALQSADPHSAMLTAAETNDAIENDNGGENDAA